MQEQKLQEWWLRKEYIQALPSVHGGQKSEGTPGHQLTMNYNNVSLRGRLYVRDQGMASQYSQQLCEVGALITGKEDETQRS